MPSEVQKLMHEMSDEPETNNISVHEFQEALVGSLDPQSIRGCFARVTWVADAKSINYVDFANLIEAKLNSKEEDENVRLKRQFEMLRRVSVNGPDKVDINKAKKRWGRMNAMAEKSRGPRKRKAEFMAKIKDMNAEARKQNAIDEERRRAKAERLKLSHMSYRQQATYMIEKQKQLDQVEREKKLERLKAANQKKYNGIVKPRDITRDGPGIEYIDGEVQLFPLAPDIYDNELKLFDGKIKTFGEIRSAKPFSDDIFASGLTAQFKKSPVLGRGEFETWEKHLDSEGKVFFIRPPQEISMEITLLCSACGPTADDVEIVINPTHRELRKAPQLHKVMNLFLQLTHHGIKHITSGWHTSFATQDKKEEVQISGTLKSPRAKV